MSEICTYTAAQVARAMGVTKRHVLQELDAIPHDGLVSARGQSALAWQFEHLPGIMRQTLTTEAMRQGYRGPESLLAMPPKVWDPPIPLKDVREVDVQKAVKLQRAFRSTLARMDNPDVDPFDLEREGLADYAREFGFSISARHWRRILKRTITRDGGAENWDRIEIFVSENAGRKGNAEPLQGTRKTDIFDGLKTVILGFKNPAAPTAKEKALLWVSAFDVLELVITQGTKELQARKALASFLQANAPHLAVNREALRIAISRKFALWIDGGRSLNAIKDKRASQSGNRTPEITEEDKRQILGHTAVCGGRLSQGFREAMREGALSVAIVSHYSGSSHKSYVPRKIRDALKTDVKLVDDWMHGPHRAKMNGAYISRDWSNVAAGDWLQGDDLTAPIEFFERENPTVLIRGQVLAMIDVATTFVLAFVLIAEKSYNARDIRNLITQTHDGYGLPREGFYFERGSWKANLVKGISWSETEIGLRGVGLRFIHAREARAKVIERVFGEIQNYMEREIGYCGRDERHDRYERTQKQMQQVRSGKLNPSEFMMSREEWVEKLDTIFARYNHERQEGKMCPGQSPSQAFQEKFTTPLRRLDDKTRYLLADYRIPAKVGRNGITFRLGKDVFNYKNETTGRLVGRDVICWFSPENPDVLSVTDTDTEEPVAFTVERCLPIPAMDATVEEMERAHRQNAEHNSYGKRLYRLVSHDFPEDFQKRIAAPSVQTPQQERLGEIMTMQRADTTSGIELRQGKENKLLEIERRMGSTMPSENKRKRSRAEAALRLSERLVAEEALIS